MRLLYQEEPRTIALYSSTHSLLLHQPRKSKKVIVEISPNNRVTRENGFKPLLSREVFGCLGLIHLDQQTFVAIISGAITNVANPVNYESVDKIFGVEFISLNSDEWDFINLDSNGMPIITALAVDDNYDGNYDSSGSSTPTRFVHPCFELKKLLSNGSFYYSNDFDLTSTLQSRGVVDNNLSSSGKPHVTRSIIDHFQKEYMWNSFLMDDLLSFRSNLDQYSQEIVDENKFLVSVIRGFAKTIPLNSYHDSITLISKQSWKRAGTRYNARGIDDDGNVANSVETEFIYFQPSKSAIFTFVQIRGSVPAFWEQDTTLINPKITITRSTEATQPIFNKHFKDILNKYGDYHIVNLLSKSKPNEISVSKRYKDLYRHSDLQPDESLYTEFDFHQETKQSNAGFAAASKILPQLEDSLARFGWFSYDIGNHEKIMDQNGVFRTNCLDCLDRTNLIQQIICQEVLRVILENQTTANASYRDRNYLEEIKAKYNTLWADNGDAISQIYTGTNALKSSFSRAGKMSFAGALSDVTKSVSRMYQNTFVDGKKQSTMDLLLGYDAKYNKPVKIFDPINDYVTEQLKLHKQEFTTYDNIKIYVGTFNLNALDPINVNDLSNWLFPPENFGEDLPDVYAIGLQELIELNASSILNADPALPGKWAKILNQQLNSQKVEYLLLRTESMTSMSLFLFVKKSQVHNITQVAGSSKKTGLGGIAANKGACGVRFDYGATSFALVTSHLAAGISAIVERYNDYATIMGGLTFTRNYTLKDHDHLIWFGDLNYRIALPNDHCRALIESGAFDELISLDQLSQEMDTKGGAFFGFSEGSVKYYPTYKYDKGTDNYDSSEKQRVPSWTDRVVYLDKYDDERLKQLNYNSVMDIRVSDHKPVYSTFNSKVKFVNSAKKIELSKKLYDQYKAEHEGDTNLLELSTTSSTSSYNTISENDVSLLDYDLKSSSPAPRLPTRPINGNGNGSINSNGNTNSPARRVPPPPTSRKSNITDFTQEKVRTAQTLPRRLPPKPDENFLIKDTPTTSGQGPPPPPPVRKTVLSTSTSALNNPTPVIAKPRLPPVGFTTTPLIPSRSNSATPATPPPSKISLASPSAPVLVPRSTSPTKSAPPIEKLAVKPLIPKKPTPLSTNKVVKHPEASKSDPEIATTKSSNKLGSISAPVPPPPRLNNSQTTPMPISMSDWKPLVPK
ncbi:inositol-1,4,5-triphosphate 5-phosphatase [Scheffersomyces amazonensis]|uniref:inositol-1,4,5-triphosphate 5-phosphatase n=1 Tax=Scheffersomyces amazonensis TaxID=1078765 RepID=UPI00315DF9A5